MKQTTGIDREYGLDDKYVRRSGPIYLTGVQALVRLPMDQRRRDEEAGLDTAGFISGYRGSPLGTYDLALWQAKRFLDDHRIRFEPGVNEDLAATAVWGSQQVHLLPGARHDGVFAIWYGKGPGVDRSCDALKHGNFSGTSPHGGVLVLAGDDPGAKSSSLAHQSEHALVHCGIPILNPANVQDYLDFGLYGWAMSRYAGCWVGFKCVTDSVESAASVEVGPGRVHIAQPTDIERPAGVHGIWSGAIPPVAREQVHFDVRLPAAQAFVRANGLDRVVLDAPRRRLGIVTAGKAYLDVRQALAEMGIDEARAARIGLAIYKIALTWPLEPEGARRFAAGLDEVIVVEEKRPLIEEQLAHILYHGPARPSIQGKRDAVGAPLLSSVGELTPKDVADALRRWLAPHLPELAHETPAPVVVQTSSLARAPAFCSGCPHNTSTAVPEGSVAQGGIGCHGMAVWLPERRTLSYTHMGAEGANWIGSAPFTDTPHIFQNMGDGTFFHSGLLAVRATVAANVNITYKILANGAVAMTGGQPVEGESIDSEVTVPDIVAQLHAERVRPIAVVSVEPDRFRNTGFPPGVTVHDRSELDHVQRSLREQIGVSAIVYDQTCAAEARRLRNRGEFPDPDRRVVINELVCEGCGDCSVQSNCISIEPVETELGRKRRINQSSCNKDYSCLQGYCPSFAVVTGGSLRKAGSEPTDATAQFDFASLPEPPVADLAHPYNVLVTGIGGTGVITVGALMGMAAHLEGKGCSVLDVTGLAQKNGPVMSHVRIAARAEDLHATRLSAGSCDLVVGCDIVVTAGAEALGKMSRDRTLAVVNQHVAPTKDFATDPDLDLSSERMERAIEAAAANGSSHFVRATPLATALLGDAIGVNLFLLGYAAQLGALPVGLAALERAIELNGRSVAMNRRALAWGRMAAHELAAVERAARPALRDERPAVQKLDEIVTLRADFLTGYQDAQYAERYRDLVARVASREQQLAGHDTPLAEAVARYYFKLLAYKDEYEVARLYTDGSFQRQLDQTFQGDYRVSLQLAPQLIFPSDRDSGRVRKISVGPWVFPLFRVLARLKFLRGTPLDVFGWTAHRRTERRLIAEYERTIAELLDDLAPDNRDLAVEIASLPEHVRGFGIVKDEHLERARAKHAELVEAFRLRSPAAGVLSAHSPQEVSP